MDALCGMTFCYGHETSYFSAFGSRKMFDIKAQMYSFTTLERYVKRLQRMYEERVNPIDSIMDPEKCRDTFRFYPHDIVQICDLLDGYLKPKTKRNNSLSVVTQVCAALMYYGSGSHMVLVGDSRHIKISKSSAVRCVDKVTNAILQFRDRFIQFPNTLSAITETKEMFYDYTGFPNSIGAIDGSHIPIRYPPGDHANQYTNRKGWPSINVEVIVDCRRKINHINPKWPGSAHDSRIFKESKLYEKFEKGKYNAFLLGDSAYALRDYMLTPIARPSTIPEERYNQAHIATRTVVENAIGMWKGRFPVIQKQMRHGPLKCAKIITATACLHNFAVSQGDIWVVDGAVQTRIEHDPADDYHYWGENDPERELNGKTKRQEVIDNYFSD